MPALYHYTDRDGYNAIVATVEWRFVARQPPSPDHPVGAYFTTLPPDTANLANRLRIPRDKLTHVFSFADAGDLTPIRGGRGAYIVYSAADYLVATARQLFAGETNLP